MLIGRNGPLAGLDARTCLWLDEVLNLRALRLRALASGPSAQGARAQIVADLDDIEELAAVLREHVGATRTRRTEPTPQREPATRLQWLSTRQAADLLRVGPRAVQLAITRGSLPAQKVGSRWQVNRSDVEAYRAAHAA